MEIQKYQLIPDDGGFTLVLYLQEDYSEFASELGTTPKTKPPINKEIKNFIKHHFHNVKINTVNLIYSQ